MYVCIYIYIYTHLLSVSCLSNNWNAFWANSALLLNPRVSYFSRLRLLHSVGSPVALCAAPALHHTSKHLRKCIFSLLNDIYIYICIYTHCKYTSTIWYNIIPYLIILTSPSVRWWLRLSGEEDTRMNSGSPGFAVPEGKLL